MSYLGAEPAKQMPEVGTNTVETQDIKDGAVTAVKLAAGAAVPSQTSQSGKYLTTDGTTASWGTITPNLKITAVTYPDNDTAVDPVGAQTITITGVSFASTPTVYIGGTIAPSVTFVSSTTLTVTTPAKSAGTYDIYVVNPDGATAIRVYGISYSGVPTWTTAAGSLGSLESTWTVQLQATSNSAVTYALASGSTLPTGVTINSSGLITGTNVTVEQTFNFSVVATDAEFQDTPRSFSVTITLSDPYFRYTTLLLTGDGTNGAQNNTFLDSSTNAFSITRNGNTTQGSFSPYGSNWSNYFGTTTSNLKFASSASFAIGTGNFTIQCSVNFTAWASTNQRICIQGVSGTTNIQIARDSGANTLFVDIQGSTIISYAWTPNVGQWYDVAVVRSGTSTNQVALYIDGVSVATGTSSASIAQNQFIVGGLDWAAGYSMQGYISNLRYSNTARTVTVPTSPYTSDANTIILTCQSNRFIDNSSNAFAITVNSTPSVQRFSPFSPTTAYSTSVIGGSGYFDGTGDYLDTTLTSTLGTGNFTAECWFNTNDLVNQPIFSIGSYASGIDVRISESAANKLDAYCYGSLKSATFTSVNSWQHFAIVRNSGTTTIYLNGALFVAGSADTNNYLGNVLRIGGLQAGAAARSHFLGYISNFRITNTAVYTTTFTPSTTPLTAISGTQFLCNMTNGAIFDNAMMNDLETVGNSQISTSVVKYGTGSMYFDGTSDYLVSNAASSNLYAFGTGDFTIEFWLYLNSMSGLQVFYDGRPASAEGLQPTIYTNSSGTLFYYTTGNRITFNSLSTNTWYHIAVSRSGSSTKMFVNGTQVGSTYTDSTNYVNPASRPMIGADGYNSGSPGGNAMNGYLDDFRITKGYARYTANFTPPASAHKLK